MQLVQVFSTEKDFMEVTSSCKKLHLFLPSVLCFSCSVMIIPLQRLKMLCFYLDGPIEAVRCKHNLKVNLDKVKIRNIILPLFHSSMLIYFNFL